MTDMYFYCVSVNATYYEKIVVQICRENETTRFTLHKFFTKSCSLCDNVENSVEPDRSQRALHVG